MLTTCSGHVTPLHASSQDRRPRISGAREDCGAAAWNRSNWTWGEVHTISFQGPLRQSGLAGDLTGNRTVAMSGSGETLLRALYPYDDPFGSKWFASLRMTADLNDPEKVRAILPGGVVGRSFNPH
ncbi:MAG: penicillin acylase family protein, partial [Pseudomonadota bacterium]